MSISDRSKGELLLSGFVGIGYLTELLLEILKNGEDRSNETFPTNRTLSISSHSLKFTHHTMSKPNKSVDENNVFRKLWNYKQNPPAK